MGAIFAAAAQPATTPKRNGQFDVEAPMRSPRSWSGEGGGKLFRMRPGQLRPLCRWVPAAAAGEIGRYAMDRSRRAAHAVAATAVPSIKPRQPVKAGIGAMAWRPDGKLIALGGFQEVRLADPSGKTVGTLGGHTEVVRAVAFSRDGRLLAAGGGKPAHWGVVMIWDVVARKQTGAIAGHSDCVYAVAFSPDGKTSRPRATTS
jgi:hypothetical protein